MKKQYYVFIAFFCIFLLFIIYKVYKNDYSNSVYVVTKNETNDKINYYEVNDRNSKREVKKFNYDNGNTYYLEKCFEAYIDRNKNKVLNKFNSDQCKIFNKDNNEVSIDEKIMKIIENVAKFEHEIIKVKIFEIDQDYYVTTMLNVNLWSPYEMYKYDNDKLELVYVFDGEDIIGIKSK